MSETKEMLEATVKGLQNKVNQLNMDLKAKQQESKVLGQKLVKRTTNKEKSTRLYHS